MNLLWPSPPIVLSSHVCSCLTLNQAVLTISVKATSPGQWHSSVVALARGANFKLNTETIICHNKSAWVIFCPSLPNQTFSQRVAQKNISVQKECWINLQFGKYGCLQMIGSAAQTHVPAMTITRSTSSTKHELLHFYPLKLHHFSTTQFRRFALGPRKKGLQLSRGNWRQVGGRDPWTCTPLDGKTILDYRSSNIFVNLKFK